MDEIEDLIYNDWECPESFGAFRKDLVDLQRLLAPIEKRYREHILPPEHDDAKKETRAIQRCNPEPDSMAVRSHGEGSSDSLSIRYDERLPNIPPGFIRPHASTLRSLEASGEFQALQREAPPVNPNAGGSRWQPESRLDVPLHGGPLSAVFYNRFLGHFVPRRTENRQVHDNGNDGINQAERDADNDISGAEESAGAGLPSNRDVNEGGVSSNRDGGLSDIASDVDTSIGGSSPNTTEEIDEVFMPYFMSDDE
ncbi:hypothetical protein M427DRAFT_236937 [Gonapodya prolifera JEL478]|uniref:Uncharacterized protein n=1 Tax=Gonapodya prolifera (strain JEL478) TaxID=1344416 RepID=A0A139AMK1_GONPJ|nr:hypothetical protein M427DRAFT_236937 [Gonapodya prolifera JEL478]|eukprot:KXS17997.1 hypothetical protein M427DRAFT_236937 [Gonapodya prolifera JEL478]